MSVFPDGYCAKPQNPKPMVTTYFCVYPQRHEGNCSWADEPTVRRERLQGEFAEFLSPTGRADQ